MHNWSTGIFWVADSAAEVGPWELASSHHEAEPCVISSNSMIQGTRTSAVAHGVRGHNNTRGTRNQWGSISVPGISLGHFSYGALIRFLHGLFLVGDMDQLLSSWAYGLGPAFTFVNFVVSLIHFRGIGDLSVAHFRTQWHTTNF